MATEKTCARLGCTAPANSYSKGLPRTVHLCDWDWEDLVWSIYFHREAYLKNPKAFLKAFLERKINGYPPDDPDFLRRAALKDLARSLHTFTRKRNDVEKSLRARQARLESVLRELKGRSPQMEDLRRLVKLFEDAEKVQKPILGALLREEPLWEAFFAKLIKGEDSRTAAGIIGEIGTARALICAKHRKPVTTCGCIKKSELADAVTVMPTRAFQAAFGIQAIPSSSDLLGYFGVEPEDLTGEGFWVAAKPEKDGKVHSSTYRRTLVVYGLAENVIEKGKGREPRFAEFYNWAREQTLNHWIKEHWDSHPPVCPICRLMKCEKCAPTYRHDDWKEGPQRAEGLPHWICLHGKKNKHHHRYHKAHLRQATLRKMGAKILKWLYHRWRHIELGEADLHYEQALALLGER